MAVISTEEMAVSGEEIRPILSFFLRHMQALANGEFSYGEQAVREKLEDIRQAITVWAGAFGLELEHLSLEELAEFVRRL